MLSGGCGQAAQRSKGGHDGVGPAMAIRDVEDDPSSGAGDGGGDRQQAVAQLLGLPHGVRTSPGGAVVSRMSRDS